MNLPEEQMKGLERRIMELERRVADLELRSMVYQNSLTTIGHQGNAGNCWAVKPWPYDVGTGESENER